MTQRLHVYLAHAGIASRRKAEKLIIEGEVVVNEQLATIGQQIDPSKDVIKVSGKVVQTVSEHKYLILNKPANVVSTTHDDQGKRNVLDLLPKSWRQYRLYPVGRLDADSEGLMLLTNDGEVAFKLTHPQFKVRKTYWTLLDHQPTPAAIDHLKSGVKLSDGWAKPITVQRVPIAEIPSEGQWWEMSIAEGRKHQVKRMWQRTGYTVERLIRVAIGPLRLGDLEVGRFRELTTAELESIFSSFS